jgi:signal transduction histidine kinase
MALRRASRRDLAVDVGVALVAFAATLGLLFAEDRHAGGRDPDAFAVLLAALATLPLVARRRWPIGVLIVATIASSLLYGFGYPDGPPIGPILAIFFVGSSGARVRGSLGLTIALIVGTLAIHLTGEAIDNERFPGPELLLGGLLWFAAWAAGDRLRLRRERTAELEERAQRAEREREREQELAVAEERTRIARDLHDSAGHAINVILVHAGAARMLRDKSPERSAHAIETIEEVARETLGEIDQLVHALRDSDGAVVEPPAGLAALDALLQRHRDAGLEVAFSVTGEQRPLGAAVDRAAYRILQESLTNALRHGGGRADVMLAYDEHALAVSVTNPATGDGAGAAGHGIVGMRERASLVGGSLHAAGENGVFRVTATLPYVTEEST